MTLRISLVLSLLALAGCLGCTKKGPSGTADGGEVDASPPLAISASPAIPAADGGLGKRPTATSWVIAGSNLDVDIAERIRRSDQQVQPEWRLGLVERLLARGQYLASIEDYERAAEIAATTLKAYPKDSDAHFAQALVLGALHQFDAEGKALDEAARLGAPPDRVNSTRVALLLAVGRYDEAEKLLSPKRSPLALTTAAVLAGRMQKPDEADRLFDEARNSILDVSPFPIAWMDFQRATLLEARGKDTQARSYYLEAVETIPVYVHALVHLATTDPPAAAITRLEAVRKVTTDPDVIAGLADAHRRAKHDAEAKTATEEARKRYDERVAKHPAAFRDHAARFYLGVGNDPKKALDPAAKNAALRPTEEAIDLWMSAAVATNDKAQICASAGAMNKLRWVSETRKRLAVASLQDCPDAGR